MADCRDCIYFQKEVIEIQKVGLSFNTWINFEDPAKPGSGAYDIALCSNQSTANGDITRDPSTAFFFVEPYSTIFGDTTVAGELDECPNHTPIT